MDRNALALAAGWGAGLQLALVVLGHFVVFVADYLFAPGGIVIAFAAGYAYGRRTRISPELGGAAAGAIGAFAAILAATILGDVHPTILVFGTLAAAAAGLAGGAAAAELRARGRRS